MADKIIKIRISADGTAAVEGIGQVNSSLKNLSATSASAASSSASITQSIKSHWVGVTAGITAAYFAVKQYMDMAGDAAKYNAQIAALDSLSAKFGTNGQAIVDSVQRSSRGLVTMADAAQLAGKQLLAGLNPSQVEQMTAVAERLSKVWGVSVAEAFETMGHAAMTGRDRALRAQGVMVDMKGAQEEFARAAGVSVTMLDAQTKQQIGFAAIAEKSGEILSRLPQYQDSVSAGYKRMLVSMADARHEMSQRLLGVFGVAYDIMMKFPVASKAVAAAVVAMGVAFTAVAGGVISTFVPSIAAAATATKTATIAMMTNPVVLAFAAAVGVAAAAFAWYKKQANEAEEANAKFVANLKSAGVDSARGAVQSLSSALQVAKDNYAKAAEKSDALSRTKFGWSSDLREARAETRYWGDEVKRIETNLKSATGVEQELTKTAVEGAKERKRQQEEIRKEQQAAEADRIRKEREGLEKSMREEIAKPVADSGGRLAEIKAEAEARRKKGVDEKLLNDWVQDQRVKAAQKASEQIDAFIKGEQLTEMDKLAATLKKFEEDGAKKEDIERARIAGVARIEAEEQKKATERALKDLEERAKAEEAYRKANAEAEMASAEQVSKFRLDAAIRAGAGEAERIRIQYEEERRVLELKQAQAAENADLAKSEADMAKYVSEVLLIQGQIEESKRREAYELSTLLVSKTKELLDLQRELKAMELEENRSAIERGMAPLNKMGNERGGNFADLTNNITDLGLFAADADPYSQELLRLEEFYIQKREKMVQQAQIEQQMEDERYLQEIERLEKRNAEAAEFEDARARYAENRTQISAKWQRDILATYQKQEKQDKLITEQQKLAIASMGFSSIASLAGAFYELSGRQSRAAFEVWKAAQIAQTVIDTYRAAQGAYAAMSGIPIVGPYLGAAAAAAAIMAGMARVQAIRSTKFGSEASVSAGAGGGFGGGAGGGITPADIPKIEKEKEKYVPPPTPNIHVKVLQGGKIVEQFESMGISMEEMNEYTQAYVNSTASIASSTEKIAASTEKMSAAVEAIPVSLAAAMRGAAPIGGLTVTSLSEEKKKTKQEEYTEAAKAALDKAKADLETLKARGIHFDGFAFMQNLAMMDNQYISALERQISAEGVGLPEKREKTEQEKAAEKEVDAARKQKEGADAAVQWLMAKGGILWSMLGPQFLEQQHAAAERLQRALEDQLWAIKEAVARAEAAASKGVTASGAAQQALEAPQVNVAVPMSNPVVNIPTTQAPAAAPVVVSAPAAQASQVVEKTNVVNITVNAPGALGVDEASLDKFARDLVPSITKAVADGVR